MMCICLLVVCAHTEETYVLVRFIWQAKSAYVCVSCIYTLIHVAKRTPAGILLDTDAKFSGLLLSVHFNRLISDTEFYKHK